MDIRISDKSFFVFDLDDTLYKEIEYLKSAYKEIANIITYEESGEELFNIMYQKYIAKENVFKWLTSPGNSLVKKKFALDKLLYLYRNHFPNLKIEEDSLSFLKKLKSFKLKLGIITDGRSVTQRNKIGALFLPDLFDTIIISEEIGTEKPSIENFFKVQESYKEFNDFYYIGDNPSKDFYGANLLGWKTICLLDDGRNIHNQSFEKPKEWLPNIGSIKKFNDINLIYN